MKCRPLFSKGFSLVELMISIVIGLITLLVVTQVLVASTERKRASVGGTDSLLNATLGLYTVERDIKNAGFGLNPIRESLGCQVKRRYEAQPEEITSLAPIVISDGASGAADEIRIMASNKGNFPLPIFIREHDQTSRVFHVHQALGVRDGDIMVAVPIVPTDDAWCSVFEVSDLSADQTEIRHAADNDRPWNQQAIFPTGDNRYWRGDYLVNLGTGVEQTYGISAGNELTLTSYNYFSDTNRRMPEVLYPHIVQLQATYGKDTDDNGSADKWDTVLPTNTSEWSQVVAVRVAIVARSTNREATQVTPDPANGVGDCSMATAVCWRPDPNENPVPISMPGADWRNYHYRVLETTVPLRNAIWAR